MGLLRRALPVVGWPRSMRCWSKSRCPPMATPARLTTSLELAAAAASEHGVITDEAITTRWAAKFSSTTNRAKNIST